MPTEDQIRKTLAVVTWLQLALGIGAVVCGCLAVVFTGDHVGESGPPYFIGTFVAAALILVSGTCLLYLHCTHAPLVDTPEQASTKSTAVAVLVTRVCLVLAIVGCVVGDFFNVVFGLLPCDPTTWLSSCYINTNITENTSIAISAICLLSISILVSLYTVCYRGLSLVKKFNNCEQPEVHRTAGFQPVEMFDIEERNGEDGRTVVDYNKTSSFRQTSDDDEDAYPGGGYHEPIRQKHVPPAQQSRNYVAVLNDPAMKQKLQERSNRLQT